MHKLHICLVLFAIGLNSACYSPSYAEARSANAAASHQNTLFGREIGDMASFEDGLNSNTNNNDNSNYDKRMERYAFGLGRRAYMYTNGSTGMKRLPVYNFGLGKRSRPYSFGLGKRTDYEDDHEYDVAAGFDRYNSVYNPSAAYMADEKPYSLGLDKRETDDLDRRTLPIRYGFGLGRR